MIGGFRAVFAAAMLVFGAFAAMPASAGVLQCVPFARQISGIDIHGNAHTWWSQASGRYERGQEPRVGAVLAFSSSRRMPVGHVAMVSRVISDREVLLTHANWSYRGGIERNVRAIDVSAAGDWSQVRVWYGPIGDLGLRSNPAHGFIYADRVEPADTPVLLASAESVSAGQPAAHTGL